MGTIRNLTSGLISPQLHVIYDIKSQTVSGGYEENDAIVSHRWDLLAHDQRVNTFEEVNLEQQPLPNLHKDWVSPEEQVARKN